MADEAGQPLAQGQMGDLLVAGGSLTSGYWRKRETTQRALYGRWLRTGDTYYQDDDGYYWYCGRADDMLKVSGQWVSPAEVEGLLFEHEAVLEAAVVGWQDAERLIKPKAFVVLKDGYRPSPELAAELQAFVKARTLPHKYPRWVEFVAELPKRRPGKSSAINCVPRMMTEEQRSRMDLRRLGPVAGRVLGLTGLWLIVADRMYRGSQVERAMDHWREALSYDPNLVQAHYLLGLSLRDQGQPEEALTHLRTTTTLDPDNATAFADLGDTLHEQGDTDGALQAYARLCGWRPSPPRCTAIMATCWCKKAISTGRSRPGVPQSVWSRTIPRPTLIWAKRWPTRGGARTPSRPTDLFGACPLRATCRGRSASAWKPCSRIPTRRPPPERMMPPYPMAPYLMPGRCLRRLDRTRTNILTLAKKTERASRKSCRRGYNKGN